MNLEGKNVVVTGGSSGIGKSVALEAARHGAEVAIVARNERNLKISANEIIEQTGRNTISVPGDVSDFDDMHRAFSIAVKELGHLDILVNCAGINIRKSLFEATEEDWDKVIRINLKGTFVCCRVAAEIMCEQRSGVIINISSVGAKRGSASPQYCASKAGIQGLSASLAKELAPFGIRVNVVAPGPVDHTGMSIKWSQSKRRKLVNETLLGRLGTPSEIAQAIIFLASDCASYITGEILDVNGGMILD